MITRAEYIDGKASHYEYYGQFMSPQLVQLVVNQIGAEAIKTSRNIHFNDIPLAQWDKCHGGVRQLVLRAVNLAEGRDKPPFSLTLSDTVCCSKAAALLWLQQQAAQPLAFNAPEWLDDKEVARCAATASLTPDTDVVIVGAYHNGAPITLRCRVVRGTCTIHA